MGLAEGMELRVEERRPPVSDSAVARVEEEVFRRWMIWRAISWAVSGREGVVRGGLYWMFGVMVMAFGYVVCLFVCGCCIKVIVYHRASFFLQRLLYGGEGEGKVGVIGW